MILQPAPLLKWFANRLGISLVAVVSVVSGFHFTSPAVVAQSGPPAAPLPIPAQFETGVVTISQTDSSGWQWVPFTRTFAAPPVVIVGPATKVDGSPMVVTAAEVSTTGFYLQLNEYEYLDGAHGTETVHFLALTEGSYIFGTQHWQVGTVGAANRTAISVPLTGFTATPVVLTQVSSYNNWTDTDGALAVKTRISGVTSTAFQVKLETQQSNTAAIDDEAVSYIAVQQGTGYLDGKILSAVLTPASVTDAFSTLTFPASRTNPVFIAQTQTINDADPGELRMQSLSATSVQVQFQEETSSDTNTAHTAEAVGYIVLGDMSGETLAKVEIGDVLVTQSNAATWTTVTLDNTYTNPVVVMGPLSYTNGTPLTIRVNNVTSNSFQFQVDRWDFGNQPHPYLEKLSYIVMESGTYAIGGVRWQAGRTTVGVNGDNTGKTQTGVVQALSGFPSTPVVFSQLATENTAQAAQSRVSAVSATGFTVEVDQSEIETRPHANESVHWIAMTPGTSNLFSSGMRIQAGTITNQDSSFRTTTFSRMVADPFLFAALQTKVDSDPATLRWRDLFADSVLMVAQEDNHPLQFGEGTVNNTHSAETCAFFVIQGAKDTDGDGAPDDWETSVGLNPLLASDGALDPDGDGLTNQQEYHNRLDFVHSSDPFTFTGGTVTISTSITNAYEINDRTIASGGTNTTAARFAISRLGGRAPITVNFTIGGTPTTDTNRQPAASTDYTLWSTTSGTGTQYTVSVPMTASSTTSYIYVRPTIYDHSPPDLNAHYPRGVKMVLASGTYTIGSTNNAIVVLNDATDIPNNQRLFVGPMLPQGGAITSASGYGTIILNGPNNAGKISTTFNGLTTPQLDVDGSHVHYSGTVIADKTIIFGEPGGLPKGPLVDYPWPILNLPSLNFSGQQTIDALYRKSGAGNLYVNVHTSRYTSGEIRADQTLQTGSAVFTPPPAAPALENLTSVNDAMRDCARFLTQATFGASEADITALYNSIPGDKTVAANRITAFTAWINAQLALSQTKLYDYNYAADQQEWQLWGQQPNLPAVVDDPNTTQIETYPAAPPPGSALDWTRWGVVPSKTGTTDDWTYRPIPTGLNKESYDPDNNNRRRAWWLAAVRGQDQLRQRVAEALEQIFVVSDRDGTITSRAYGHSRFYDMLGDFVGGVRHLQPPNGSYCTLTNSTIGVKELLKDVSMSPIMGQYLSHLKNQKQTVDGSGNVITSPDENYAREVMQLFSIGLLKLWEDGTLQLGTDGQPIATYSNDDIKGLAKVFTGWSFSCVQNSAKLGYVPPVALSNTDSTKQSTNFFSSAGAEYFHPGFENPMQNYPNYHDEGTKAFLGTTQPAYGGTATDYPSRVTYANTELDSTINTLFTHANIAPFLSYRLIQRLVTSNPSRGYVYRVTKAFEDSAYPGTGGIRGSMPAVLKAILLDYEARSLTNVDPQTVNSNTSVNVSFGKVKEPMIRYIQALRAFGAKSQLPVSALSSFGYPSTQLSNLGTSPTRFRYGSTVTDLAQTPNDMPSVFNWYLPDYSPGGQVSAAGLVAPELQIITENIAVRCINYHRTIDYSSVIDPTAVLPAGQGTSNILGDTTTGTVLDNVFIDLSGITTDYMTNRNATGATETSSATYLVDRLDALLCSGSLKAKYPYTAGSTDPRSIMIDSLATISVHAVAVPVANAGARVRAALYLITSTPEFIVQK